MPDTGLELIETTVAADAIRMRYADHSDATKAKQWVDFRVSLAGLEHPNDRRQPLGDPDLQFVAEVRLAALHYVRDVLAAETQRLVSLSGQIR